MPICASAGSTVDCGDESSVNANVRGAVIQTRVQVNWDLDQEVIRPAKSRAVPLFSSDTAFRYDTQAHGNPFRHLNGPKFLSERYWGYFHASLRNF